MPTSTRSLPLLIPDRYRGNDGADWSALAASPTPFGGAILKATEGTSYETEWFITHWPALRQAGQERYGKDWFRGCYHFLQFQKDPVEQADFFLQTVEAAGGFDFGDLPPIIDVERGPESNRSASARQVIDATTGWVQRVKSVLGEQTKVILYGRRAMSTLGITERMGCDYLWTPVYGPTLTDSASLGWPKELVLLWQYTDGKYNKTDYPHTAPGLGNSDLSVLQGELSTLRSKLLWRNTI